MPSVFTYSNVLTDEEGLAWARTEMRIRQQENKVGPRSTENAHEMARQRSLRAQKAGVGRAEIRRFLDMARRERDEATSK